MHICEDLFRHSFYTSYLLKLYFTHITIVRIETRLQITNQIVLEDVESVRAGMGNVQPTGHMWPAKYLNVTSEAFWHIEY